MAQTMLCRLERWLGVQVQIIPSPTHLNASQSALYSICNSERIQRMRMHHIHHTLPSTCTLPSFWQEGVDQGLKSSAFDSQMRYPDAGPLLRPGTKSWLTVYCVSRASNGEPFVRYAVWRFGSIGQHCQHRQDAFTCGPHLGDDLG